MAMQEEETEVRSILRLFQPFDTDTTAAAQPRCSDGGRGVTGGSGAANAAAAVRIDRLAGYDDLNYRVTPVTNTDQEEAQESPLRYVLKITNAIDTAKGTAIFEAQHAVMAHIADSTDGGIVTNRPVPLCSWVLAAARGSGSSSGSSSGSGSKGETGGCGSLPIEAPAVASATDDGFVAVVAFRGEQRAVRLLTFVEGSLLVSQQPTPQLFRQVGALAARLTAALSAFDHPSLHGPPHDWSLETVAATLARKLPAVTSFDARQRALVTGAAARFEAAVARAAFEAGGLPRQPCHTDLNEHNIVLVARGSGLDVSGVIDWGDSASCWRVVEVAVAAAYAALLAAGGKGGSEGTGEGPLAAPRSVVEGYLAAGGELTPAERTLAPALIEVRIAQSLTNGAFAAAAEPSNSDYLLQTQRPGWICLGLMQGKTDPELAAALLPASVLLPSVACKEAVVV